MGLFPCGFESHPRHKMPKRKLPDKDFDWTPEVAYAVGLIATDGCLSSDERHIIMRSSDIQLLKTFKKCLGLSNKIVQSKHDGWAKKPCYRIQFGNIQFYKWLSRIGLTPRKTHTIGELKIPDKCFPDFLRGHLGGDGSVWTYKDYWNTSKNSEYVYTRLYVRFISASKNHIYWLRERIHRIIDAKGDISREKRDRLNRSTVMWNLRFAKKESMEIIKWIYYDKNMPCLKRKRNIALSTVKKISKEKRKKYTRVKGNNKIASPQST